MQNNFYVLSWKYKSENKGCFVPEAFFIKKKKYTVTATALESRISSKLTFCKLCATLRSRVVLGVYVLVKDNGSATSP